MQAILRHSRPIACLVVLALVSLWLPQHPARAAMVTTESIIAAADTQADRARVRTFLDREDVRARIEAYGLNPDEAAARVDSLTDSEIATIAEHLDSLPAGGSAAGYWAAELAIIVVIILFAGIVLMIKEFIEAVSD